jgi:hydroxyacylglutathione hydrolase
MPTSAATSAARSPDSAPNSAPGSAPGSASDGASGSAAEAPRLPAGLEIFPIPAFRDNYIWTLAKGGRAIVVDPGDAQPVRQALRERGLQLDTIVVTHHHADHVGGVAELARESGARVYGPANSPFGGIDDKLRDGQSVTLHGYEFQVLTVPGHTLDHIAYWSAPLGVVFCGDTLFACGCGRLFEGTAAQMSHSLGRLARLPEHTLVYCAHEYTLGNLRFALAVEPANAALQRRQLSCTAQRERNEPTVPSTVFEEKATNPFLRCSVQGVRDAVA